MASWGLSWGAREGNLSGLGHSDYRVEAIEESDPFRKSRSRVIRRLLTKGEEEPREVLVKGLHPSAIKGKREVFHYRGRKSEKETTRDFSGGRLWSGSQI